jgi:tetratricopeptide (TPR) repeat protein
MKISKLTLAAIFTLVALFAAVATPAETPQWAAVSAAGDTARQHGELALAQTLYTQAIDLQQKALGANNPEVAISLNNLAVFYQDQSQYPLAEQSYKQSVAILEKDPRQKAQLAQIGRAHV